MSKKVKFKINSEGNTLVGKVLIPAEKKDSYPVVVISHAFGSCMRDLKKLSSVFLDEGYVTVIFDFCMSSFRAKSSGKTTGMSVITEKKDLLNVINYIKGFNEVKLELNHLVLAGCSQGGFVSALAAADVPDDVEKLILYYPALCVVDDIKRGQILTAKFDPDNIPDTFKAIFVKLSRERYVNDVKDMDVYGTISKFEKPVLLIHGIEDTIVAVKYSQDAAKAYKNAELHEIHGDHGFFKAGFDESVQITKDWLKKN